MMAPVWYTSNEGVSNQTITNELGDLPWTSPWKISPSTITSGNPTLLDDEVDQNVG